MAGQRKEQEARIPILNPDPVLKSQLRGVKPGQNARRMTANELATAADRRAKKAQEQAENNAAILQAREKNQERRSILEPSHGPIITSYRDYRRYLEDKAAEEEDAIERRELKISAGQAVQLLLCGLKCLNL